MMKKIICDLDNTITIDSTSREYSKKLPNIQLICKLREYSRNGYSITIFTARNMNTYKGKLQEIEKHTLPGIIA
jgi:capsule biosynthesis phosphatase